MIGLDGFTPAPDEIAQRIDPLAALVFGAVYRTRFMRRGQLDASVDTVARTLGLGTTTVRDRLRRLEADGWIVREERPGRTSVYRDAGRWEIRIRGGVSGEGATRGVGVGQREALGGATSRVAENTLQKTNKTRQPRTQPKGAAEPRPLAFGEVEAGIAEMTGLQLRGKAGRKYRWAFDLISVAHDKAKGDPALALRVFESWWGDPAAVKDRRFKRNDEWAGLLAGYWTAGAAVVRSGVDAAGYSDLIER